MAASRLRLRSSCSGALSCTTSASATAAARSAVDGQVVHARARREAQLGERGPGGVDEAAQPRLGVRAPGPRRARRTRGPGSTPPSRRRSPRRPTQATVRTWSGATALGGHRRGRSARISRASSGVATSAPIAVMIVTALRDELRVGRPCCPGRGRGCPPGRPARGRRAAPTAPPTASACARSRTTSTPRPVGICATIAASRRGLGRGAVRDAHAQLVHRRVVDQALGDELVGEPQVPGVEDLQLGPHAQLLDPLGARAQHVRRADVDQAALAEVQAAAVERADVGQQLLDVREPRRRR